VAEKTDISDWADNWLYIVAVRINRISFFIID